MTQTKGKFHGGTCAVRIGLACDCLEGMQQPAQPTPGPWHIFAPLTPPYELDKRPKRGVHSSILIIADEVCPATATGSDCEEALANARHIVRAVNSYDAMLEALEFALRDAESRLYMLPVGASEQKSILAAQVRRYKAACKLARGE